MIVWSWQAKLFAGASVIVGAHGAALANTIFSPEGNPHMYSTVERRSRPLFTRIDAMLTPMNPVLNPTGTLVIELGFRSPFTHHYRHASAALGHQHKLVHFEPDERGVGAPQVSASAAALQGAIDAVAAHLDRSPREL